MLESSTDIFVFLLDYCERLTADIPDENWADVPSEGMNSPVWIVGHLAIGADFISGLLGHTPKSDETGMKTFGPGSIPQTKRETYPSKEDMMTLLRTYWQNAIDQVAEATPEQLQQPNKTPFFPDELPTIEHLITHLLTSHAALHLGQLSAWRRYYGYPSVLGV